MKKTLSIVVPCFNEAGCIEKFIEAINALEISNPIEFIFVDDGSQDGTLENIRRFSESDERVHYVSFSRNFGKESALLAGLEKSTGDMVVTMDADLQHRPELLVEMISGIEEEGFDCVATRRTTREGEPLLRSWLAHRFYNLMNRYSDVGLVDGAMDYRMMTRRVVSAILNLREVNRFTKGIYEWVGFKTKWIECTNRTRVAGESKWSLMSLFLYSIKGIIAFSTAPLQIASIFGSLCCMGALGYMVYIAFKGLVLGDRVAGWPTIMCVVLFLGGLNLFVIGILGTYIAFIYREVKHRPVYIVKESK